MVYSRAIMNTSVMKKSVAVAILALGALFFPIMVRQEQSLPKEDTRYIRRVYQDHTVGQRFRHEYDIDVVSVLVRSNKNQMVDITLTDPSGTHLASRRVSVTNNDQWFRLALSPALPAGEHELILHAPQVSTLEEAVLVRFQIDSDRYPDGEMIVNGTASYGDVAFQTYEQAPLWRAVQVWGQITDKAAQRGLRRISWSTGLTIAAWLIGKVLQRLSDPRLRYGIPLFLIALLAIAIRAPYSTSIEGVFGGDAFNYLSKAADLVAGNDPFASDPRKAPLFSFLLLPGLSSPDPLLWSRWVGIIAAGAAAGLLPHLAYRLGLPWLYALASGVLLAVNQEFIWEAPSGLANTVYTALIIATAIAFTYARARRGLFAVALVGGLVPLTRYEGAVIPLTLLPAAWIRHRAPLTTILATVLTTLAIAGLPLVSYFLSGSSGIRAPRDLLTDEGLLLAYSREDLLHNVDLFAAFLRDSWVLEETSRVSVGLVWLAGVGSAVLATLARWHVPKHTQRWLQYGATAALLCVVGIVLFTKSSAAHAVAGGIPIVLGSIGIVELMKKRPYETGALTLAVALHTMAIILILPKSRYFLPLLPFWALTAAAGLALLLKWPKMKTFPLFPAATIAMLAVFFYHDATLTLQKRLEWYNGKAQDTAVMIAASKYIRQHEGRVAFRSHDEQPVRIYVPAQRQAVFRPTEPSALAEQEQAFFHDNNITYLVERNRQPYWESVRVFPDQFELIQTFTSRHGESKVMIYHKAFDRKL